MSYSDHEWLGRIPSHWELRPLQYCLMECKERNGPEPVGEMLSVSGYTGVSVKEYEHDAQKRSPEELEDYRVVRPGQLVVNTMWLNHRGLGVSPHVGYVSPAYSVYSVGSDLDERFIHYLMRSNRYVDRYKSLLYGIRPNSLQIKSHDWDSIPLLIPPLDDQRAVANFLDRETSRIDKLIDRKKRLIELLEEKRTTLTTRAVTKGFDPDVPRKESGVEWLGEIPEHWEVRRLKTIAHVIPSNVDKKSDSDELPVRLCNYTDVYYSDIIEDAEELMAATASLDEVEKFRLKSGDVVITKDSESPDDIAVPAYVPEDMQEVLCGYHLAIVRSDERMVLGRFLRHSFLSRRISQQFHVKATGITRYGLSVDALKGAWFVLPPLSEQARIAAEIDETGAKLARITSKLESAIDYLTEYRAALISAAVTGKIDVRDQAA